MSDETIDDIVAEMRQFAKRHWMHDEGQNMKMFASRIEAAWNREKNRYLRFIEDAACGM